MRRKKSELQKLRDKADALLTPLIKHLFPRCLLCGGETEVAHHHVHKSKSLVLRYNPDNLIPLCGKCHFKLHQNESYWASKIVEIRGMDWWMNLRKAGEVVVKGDKYYFARACEILSNL